VGEAVDGGGVGGGVVGGGGVGGTQPHSEPLQSHPGCALIQSHVKLKLEAAYAADPELPGYPCRKPPPCALAKAVLVVATISAHVSG